VNATFLDVLTKYPDEFEKLTKQAYKERFDSSYIGSRLPKGMALLATCCIFTNTVNSKDVLEILFKHITPRQLLPEYQ
jgi:hypothetical protein